ncbi:MAG TPA: DUF547 domain-containing protein [Planctomycetia bacterium]|nr:DUF547 domain-containing protein [Planctomycetia bacterium]
MRQPISIFLIAAAAFAAPLGAAETERCKVRVGAPVAAGTALVPFAAFDHSSFDSLLRQYVDCDGLVSYGAWKKNCGARAQLEAYLQSFAALDVADAKSDSNARLATYVNAYNALVIHGILREYPTVSIQAHNRERAPYRIFDDLELCVGGTHQSLNALEHEIIRPFGDPRIHFALVCAARGCPKLRNEAYAPERFDCQVDDNGRDFFAEHSRWHVIRGTRIARVSPILQWFDEDFGTTDAEVLARIMPYLPEGDRNWLERHPRAKLTYLGYNWALNDKHPPPFQRAAALPYTLYSRIEPGVRPVTSLVRVGSGEKSASGSSPAPAAETPAQPPVQPPPNGEEPPPPKVIKPDERKKAEEKKPPEEARAPLNYYRS